LFHPPVKIIGAENETPVKTIDATTGTRSSALPEEMLR
jgi:hypothetical protein